MIDISKLQIMYDDIIFYESVNPNQEYRIVIEDSFFYALLVDTTDDEWQSTESEKFFFRSLSAAIEKIEELEEIEERKKGGTLQ